MGSRPVAWPLSLATKRCRMPKNTYSGSHPATFAQGLPKKRVFPGYPPTQQGTHMVPLQHPWGRAPSLGPCLWQRSAAGCPKTPILGPTRPLSPKVSLKNEFSLGTHLPSRVPTWSLYNTHGVAPLAFPSPKVSLKNEFSLGTHQAGRVPTWSLYNTHGVAPLRLAPFLGYTGVIPMLIHSHNTPPQHLYPQSP